MYFLGTLRDPPLCLICSKIIYTPPLTAGSDFPSLRSLSLDVIADHLDQLSGCLQQELNPALEEEVREHARKKRYYPVIPIRSRPLGGREDGSDNTQFLFGVDCGWDIPQRKWPFHY